MKSALITLVVTATLILSITSASAVESSFSEIVTIQAVNSSFQVALNILKF